MKRLAPTLVFLLLLAGCATMPREERGAAVDIQRFLIAVRDSDRAAFERYVDREALTIQLRSRLLAEAGRQAQGGRQTYALGALAAAPLVGLAADTFIQPEVFRAMAERKGFRPEMGMPEPSLIARYLRDIGGGAVCVTASSDGPCLVTFRDQGGTWRLVAYDGELSALLPRMR